MAVPHYCTSREGKVFRVLRSSSLVGPDRIRYSLRAVPVNADPAQDECLEVARELDTATLRERIALRQTITTPEQMFEQLWQQLRLDVDVSLAPPLAGILGSEFHQAYA